MNRELAFASLLLIWAGAVYGDDYATDSYAEPAEDRVGRIFWARAALSETSVDFFRDLERRERIPVREKRRFRILDIQATDRFPHPDILYRVRFDSQEEAYIGLDAFESLLYREPKRNQAVTSVFRPPAGVGVHVYIFERSGIFGADPDVIWARIKNDGPRSFIPAEPE
jgi:hypothetical protein